MSGFICHAANKPPTLAPIMPPMLNRAWNRDILGLATALSTATPCALIATSFVPAMAPNSTSARNKDIKPVAKAGAARAIEKPRVLHTVIRLLPNLLINHPVIGMAQTDPIAVPKRQRPRRALLKLRAFCTAGMPETQVETINPWRRKRETTAHHAAEILFVKPSLGIVSCTVSTI